MKKIIVIVPAYCEEEIILKTVRALKELQPLFEKKGFAFFIYVINDGSTDKTAENARLGGADKIIQHRVNQGLGSAVRTGLQVARRDHGDILVKFDADLQHDPMDIMAIIQPILDDEAEIVYGNRFEKINFKMAFVRRAGNMVFSGLMRRLTNWPVVDSQPGIFAVSKEYLDVFYIPGDYNYTQQILLDAFHKGMRFAQVPVTFNKRVSGTSFVSFRYPFKVLPQIIQVLVGVKPLRVFGPISLIFLGTGTLVGVLDLFDWIFGGSLKPIQHVNLVLGTGLFGLQTAFFGILADLIVKQNIQKRNMD